MIIPEVGSGRYPVQQRRAFIEERGTLEKIWERLAVFGAESSVELPGTHMHDFGSTPVVARVMGVDCFLVGPPSAMNW